MKYKIIVDKQSRTNPSADKKEYIIDIEELRAKGDTCDSLVITKTEDYVMRRLELTDFYVLKELETPKKEILKNINIELFEGDNYIYLIDMVGNKFYAEYLIKNEFNDTYATKNEMNSAIELTAQNINLSVNQMLQNYSTTEEMNSAIQLLSNAIALEVAKKVNNEDYTSAQILLKINNDTSESKIKADKISLIGKTISLTSDNINISSSNFNVDKNGNLSCTNANITGNLNAGSKIKGSQIIGGSISIGDNNEFYVNNHGTTYCSSLHVKSKEDYCSFSVNADDDTRLIEFTNNAILLRKTSLSPSAISIGIQEDGKSYISLDNNGAIILANLISINLNSAKNGGNLSVNGTNAIISCEGIIQATNFVNTSEEFLKSNIQKLTDKIKKNLTTKTALDIIKNTDICEFYYKGETEKTVGLVIEEGYKTPIELIKTIKNDNGKASKGIDLYTMISLAYKAIQELADKINNMEVND